MTVSTTVSSVSYTANGTQTTFPYTFKIFEDADLLVILRNNTTGVETTQTLTTDYTVTNAGNDAGGNVVFGTAPASGNTVFIRRVLDATQTTDYVENDPFPAESHEDALDKLTMLIQQGALDEDRAILFPESDAGAGLNNVLPSSVARASSFLTFDGGGNVTVTSVSDPGAPSTITKQNFTGDGSTVAFTLAADPGGAGTGVSIYIDGVYQNRDTYTISGTSLIFTEAPPLNASVEYLSYRITNIGATTADAVTYTPSGTGAEARTVANKLGEFVSVKDFGAVGDGVTDDTAAIQDALNAVKKVYVPDGTYLCSTVTVSSDNTHIWGSKGAILKLKNSVDVDLLDLSNFDNLTISDITLDGNKANQTTDVDAVCIRGDDNSNVVIQNCIIKNSALSGVNIRNSDGVKIVNNLITDCGTKNSINSGDGIYLAFNSNDYVSGNSVINPARIGIILKGSVSVNSSRSVVIGNFVNNSGENAIGTEDGNVSTLIVNNIVDTSGDNSFASTKAGIVVGETGETVTVSGNRVVNAGSFGIEVVHGADETIVTNNNISSSGSIGIFATAVDGSGGLDNLLINGNLVTTTVTDGIFISAAATNPLTSANINKNINILNNVVRDAARDAIVCSAMLDFSVSNNSIHSTTTGAGIRVINSEEGSVCNNYITEANSRGVYIQGSTINCDNISVRDNTVVEAGTWGVFLTASDNGSIMGNTVKNRASSSTTTVGIRSEGAGNSNLIVNNDVRGIGTGISSAVSGTADTTTPNFT